jgi:ABC-type transporter Mla MlaB component
MTRAATSRARAVRTDQFLSCQPSNLLMTPDTPRTITFAIRGPIERGDLPGLYDRVCKLLADNRGCIGACDVAGVHPDAVAVEALARLQLAARRHGCQLRLRNASHELLELVDFMGLGDVLPA